MNFDKFQAAVAKQFKRMQPFPLFRTNVSKDDLWKTYLAAFPAGTDLVYRKRSEHDCACCKQFIRAVGNVVAIIDGKVETLWDGKISDDDNSYQVVSDALAAFVRSQPINDAFLHYEPTAGTAKNFEKTVEGIKTWTHFHVSLPATYVVNGKDIASRLSVIRSTHDVFERGLRELSLDSLDTVLELIAQKGLYRGEEHKFAVTSFRDHKKAYEALPADAKLLYPWTAMVGTPGSVTNLRNTSVGTLVIDISEGKELEHAIKAFHVVMAPGNYKHPMAPVTKAMIDKTKAQLQELGYIPALERRHAFISDITVNNVLWADKTAKKAMGSVLDDLVPTKTTVKNFDRVDEVSIEKFLADILPTATSLEVMMDNGQVGNLVSLVAPVDPTSPGMFKWNNAFSWSYNGDVADSLRQKVAAAGGRVDGVLRFTHSWNHVGRNASLMDLHVFMPGSTNHKEGKHDLYPVGQRVGWNCRNDAVSGGTQDVDFTADAPEGYVPVENITFPSMSKLKEGKYTFKIHNWQLRSPTTSGFKAEIEFGGQVFEYEHPKPLGHKEWVTVAEATLKNGVFTIDHKIPHGATSKQVWGIPTLTFTKVSAVMMSPNYWDGQGVGNKHYFFMLEKCKNEGQARGFYNEFLKPELDAHRKTMELVGVKMRTENSDQQLSGLGFSSTQRNSVLCKVTGAFSRVIKVTF